jgi:hypothetical protein
LGVSAAALAEQSRFRRPRRATRMLSV